MPRTRSKRKVEDNEDLSLCVEKLSVSEKPAKEKKAKKAPKECEVCGGKRKRLEAQAQCAKASVKEYISDLCERVKKQCGC